MSEDKSEIEKVAVEEESPENEVVEMEAAETEVEGEVLEAVGEGEDDNEEELMAADSEESDEDSGEKPEDLEFLEHDQIVSIVESVLFATDKPQSVALIKHAFRGTQVKSKHIRKAIEELKVDYAGGRRGVTLEEISGGYQLRTKYDNLEYLRRMVKGRSFKLSGPALETLAIIAYKQPCVKFHVDEVRGVESGHLVRSLMERGLVKFAGKSELPGKPMLYETTRKFLEIFGLRNIKELPSISEIDELIPEGIDTSEEKKETLDELTDKMSKEAGETYSESEEELQSITEQLGDITTSSDFFEQEKQRMRDKRDADRATDIRDALTVGEEVSDKDKNWLERYEKQLAEKQLVEKAEELNANEEAQGEEPLEVASESSDEATAQEGFGEDDAELLDQILAEDEPNVEAQAPQTLSAGEVDFKKLEEDMKIFDEPMDEGVVDEATADPHNP